MSAGLCLGREPRKWQDCLVAFVTSHLKLWACDLLIEGGKKKVPPTQVAQQLALVVVSFLNIVLSLQN